MLSVEALLSGMARPGGDRLSHVLRRSTIGAEGFHGRVREGIGCWGPRYGHQAVSCRSCGVCVVYIGVVLLCTGGVTRSDTFIEDKPDERLVRLGYAHCWTSTCLLSTWWSTTALQGDLILRGASRLDAFSGYPVRT